MIELKLSRGEQRFQELEQGDAYSCKWIPVAIAAASALYGAYQQNQQKKALEDPENRTTEQEQSNTPTIPGFAQPYVTGDQIREWPVPQINPDFQDYARGINQGSFAGQQIPQNLLSFNELSQGGAPMENLLGIGGDQAGPEMFLPEPKAATQAQDQAQMDPNQYDELMRRMSMLEQTQGQGAGGRWGTEYFNDDMGTHQRPVWEQGQ